MPNDRKYMAIESGYKKKIKGRPSNDNTKRAELLNIPQVDFAFADDETLDMIKQLSCTGFSNSQIAFQLGMNQHVWQVLYDDNPKVEEALKIGRMVDEIECITKLRESAVSPRSTNFLASLKYYWNMKFGAGGTGDLPASLSFTMIEPEIYGDEDEE